MSAARTGKHAALCALLAYAFFGFSFAFSKTALQLTSPAVLLAARFLVAFVVSNLLLLTGKFKVSFRGKPIGKLLLLGILDPLIYFYSEAYGILYTNSAFSGVMIALIPLAALLMGAFFLREHPTGMQVGFCLLSIVGVVLITLQNGADGVIRPLGVLLLIVSVLSAAGFTVLGRDLAQTFTPFERSYFIILLGVVVFIVIAVLQNLHQPAALLAPFAHPSFWLAIGYLGICCSVGSYFLMNYAVTYLTAARVAAFCNVTTVLSIFTGVVFMKEPFHLLSCVAAVMILIGIWGVQRGERKQAPSPPAE